MGAVPRPLESLRVELLQRRGGEHGRQVGRTSLLGVRVRVPQGVHDEGGLSGGLGVRGQRTGLVRGPARLRGDGLRDGLRDIGLRVLLGALRAGRRGVGRICLRGARQAQEAGDDERDDEENRGCQQALLAGRGERVDEVHVYPIGRL